MVNIDDAGTMGVFAIRYEDEGWTTAGRVFYIYGGELFYKDFYYLDIIATAGVTVRDNRLWHGVGDWGGYTSLFGMVNGRLTETSALLFMVDLLTEDVEFAYLADIPPGTGGWMWWDLARRVSEAEYNEIEAGYGLDNTRSIFDMPDETQRILEMFSR